MAPRATFNYRNQWPGIPGTFVTSAFSYDQHVNSLHGGIGIMFVNDKMASSLQSNRISAIYSYQMKLSRNFSIRAGLEGTFWQKNLNYSQLTFGDMIDPIRGFVYQTGDVFTENGTFFIFDKPQSSISKGQFVVWYNGDELIGSGVID